MCIACTKVVLTSIVLLKHCPNSIVVMYVYMHVCY